MGRGVWRPRALLVLEGRNVRIYWFCTWRAGWPHAAIPDSGRIAVCAPLAAALDRFKIFIRRAAAPIGVATQLACRKGNPPVRRGGKPLLN